MKKLIEIKKDTNYTVCVLGRGLAVYFNHRLIRFSVAEHCRETIDTETIEIRQIDASNAAICRASVSAKTLSGFLNSGMPIQGFLFFDRVSGDPIGYYWLFFDGARDSEYSVRGNGEAALISYVYVFDGYRGRRMAALLYRHAFAVCSENAVKDLYASVRKNNTAAWKAYERIGFEDLGPRKFLRLLGRNIPSRHIP